MAGIVKRLTRFQRASSGVAAVEFALIVPFLIATLVCTTELMRANNNYDKAISLARTVADITAQGDASADPMRRATMNDIFAASALVLRPFASANAKVVVSSVGVYSVGGVLKPRVCSSVASTNATARPTGYPADLTVPVGYQTDKMRYVLAEVTVTYTPMLGQSLVRYLGANAGNFTWNVKTPWPVRNGILYNSTYPEVTMPNGSVCPAAA